MLRPTNWLQDLRLQADRLLSIAPLSLISLTALELHDLLEHIDDLETHLEEGNKALEQLQTEQL